MNIRIGIAALASLTVTATASAAVEWKIASGGNGSFTKLLERQTGTKAVKEAGPNTLVFHLKKDKFVESLNLDCTGMHPYGYFMVKRGNDIALVGAGGGDGGAYACTDFLKRFTGYRSYGGGKFGEVVPKIDRIDLPAEFTIREEPDVASVWIAGDGGWDGSFARVARQTCISTHALSDLVPEKLYAEHPEYFPLIDGKRRDPASGAPWNPCMSNPDLPDLVRAYAKRYFEKHPKFVGLPLGVNDGGGDCCCEKCRALLAKNNNQYVEFYNEAAKILAKEFPGKLVSFISYMSSANPPREGFRMEPNILVEKTGHAVGLTGWRKAGVRHFGNYTYLFGLNDSRMAPAYYPHFIAKYLREYHRDFGLTTYWEEYYPDCVIFDACRQYVINELLWHMDADVDALVADYHEKMFGPAAKAMRRFSDTCEAAFVDNPERGESFIMEWNNAIQFNGWTFDRIAACTAALKEAAAAAKPGSTEAWRISLLAKFWEAMWPLMDSWQCGLALGRTDDLDEALRLARRGLADIEAFHATSMSPVDEKAMFNDPWDDKKGLFRAWKEQTASGFAPLPPLEFGIDGAFERIAAKLGPEKAKAAFTPLLKDPKLSTYALTRLYLMDHEPVDVVVNGSFEETCEPKRSPGDDKDWNPLGAPGGWVWWKFPNTEARAYVDDTEAHTGKRCAALANSSYGVALVNKWKAEPRTRYRMSCWVKERTANGRAKGTVCIRLKNGKGEWIDVTFTAISRPIPNTAVGKWAEIKFIFTTPDRNDGLYLVPLFGPDGTLTGDERLWVDDVRLEKLCEVPALLPKQAAVARETLMTWLAGWDCELPKAVVDETVQPTGTYIAEKTPQGVVLRGGAEGLRIGLYAWARACGVRWFSPGEDPIIPAKPEEPPADFFRRHEPSFPYRGLHVCGCPGHFDPKVGQWMSFMGMNRRLDTLNEALRGAAKYEALGLVSDTTVHSFDTIIPAWRFYNEHPDYFSLLGGKRAREGGQLCLGNPKLRSAFVKELGRWIACEPNVSPVGICPNDGFGWCECEKCRALDSEEDVKNGRVDGRVADFVKYVCGKFPNVTIGNYCYSNFSDFYKHLDPFPKNLTLSVTAFHCQAHGLGDESCKGNAGARWRIRTLRGKGASLYLYDYYFYRWDTMPAPMWKTVGEDFRFLAKEGVKGFVCESEGAASAVWASFWPAWYTAANMLLDVTTDVDRLVDDWCARRYGKAAPEMREYFREWEKALAGPRCWTKEKDDLLWVMRPEAGRPLEAALRKDPTNAAVLRAKKQFDGWLDILEKRKRYPTVREVTVGAKLTDVPVHVVDTTTLVKDEENPTDVALALTDKDVTVRLTMNETRMDDLRYGSCVYYGDNVEIFFADGKDPDLCYHFLVDPNGRVEAAESKKSRWNWSWEHHADIKTAKGKGAWTVELKMPLAGLNAANDEVRFTVARNRHAGGEWKSSGAPAGGAFFKIKDYIRISKEK